MNWYSEAVLVVFLFITKIYVPFLQMIHLHLKLRDYSEILENGFTHTQQNTPILEGLVETIMFSYSNHLTEIINCHKIL